MHPPQTILGTPTIVTVTPLCNSIVKYNRYKVDGKILTTKNWWVGETWWKKVHDILALNKIMLFWLAEKKIEPNDSAHVSVATAHERVWKQ